MKKGTGILLICALVGISILGIVFAPKITAMRNKYEYAIQKADDATNYETLKEVEDTCRAMISSYEADKLTYEQYKNAETDEKRSWAEQAKMRANKTAVSYNNYILKNNFVWKNNVPNDIYEELAVLD